MNDVTQSELVYLYSGAFLRWNEQASGISATNGAPTSDVSGVDVQNFQFAKLFVTPNSGATVDFRLWFQYEGLAKFFAVDGGERNGISNPWTQEINIAGVERVYIEILSIDTGTVDVHVAQAESQETLVGIKRIGRWEEAGTGDQDGDILVWARDDSTQAIFRWDGSTSNWTLQSTQSEWFLIEDWSSGVINSNLWTTVQDSGDATVDAVNNHVEVQITSTGSEALELDLIPRLPRGTTVKSEVHLDGMSSPTSGNIGCTMFLKALDGGTETRPGGRAVIEAVSSPSSESRCDGNYFDNAAGVDDLFVAQTISSADIHVMQFAAFDFEEITIPHAFIELDDGTNVADSFSSTITDVSYTGNAFMTLRIQNNSANFTGGPNSPWFGKVWIKR